MGVSNPFEFDCPLIFHFIKTNQNMMLCFISFANEFMKSFQRFLEDVFVSQKVNGQSHKMDDFLEGIRLIRWFSSRLYWFS